METGPWGNVIASGMLFVSVGCGMNVAADVTMMAVILNVRDDP